MATTKMLSKKAAATAGHDCPKCGKPVRARQIPSGDWYIATFCSRACGASGRWPERPGNTCEQCERVFVTKPGHPLTRRYCSRACLYRAQAQTKGLRNRRGYWTFWTGMAEVPVHRIVMERRLGRPLRDTETVHHINGQRGDFRDENLELWDHAQPHGQRVPDKIAWCVEYLTLHGYVVTAPSS